MDRAFHKWKEVVPNEQKAKIGNIQKSEKPPKIFVLDTNVILHDYNSIYNFQENDLVIPLAVLEELDKFKKGNDTINYNAREFVRHIDRISDPRLFNSGSGYPLGKGKGRLGPQERDCAAGLGRKKDRPAVRRCSRIHQSVCEREGGMQPLRFIPPVPCRHH